MRGNEDEERRIVPTPLVDRFHFMARAGQQTKTPIRAEAPEPKTADGVAVLRLYDPIDWDGGFWGVSAKEFTAVLDELGEDVETIELHVNSPGGMVWDGLAIMNSLRQHPARVVVIVDGIAASAASFIALAGDEVVMAQGAEMMIHSPFGLCVGNAQDMAKMAKDLDHETDNLARIYQAKAGGELDDWRAALAAETWYSAEEAVAAGLADRVLDQPVADASPKARFDLTVFAYAGRDQAPAPQTPAASAAGRAAAGGTTPKEDAAMADTLTDGLRQRLGIADDADEATILAALDEALTGQADPKPGEPAPLPEGVEAIDATVLAELRTQAAAGAQARSEQVQSRRDQLVKAAIKDGRITAAQHGDWLAKLEAEGDKGEQVLSGLAKGLVPVDSIGHDNDAPADTPATVRESAAYKNWS